MPTPDPFPLIASLQATVLDLVGRVSALEQRAAAHPPATAAPAPSPLSAAAGAQPHLAPTPAAPPATKAKRRPRSSVLKAATAQALAPILPASHAKPTSAAKVPQTAAAPTMPPGRGPRPPAGKPPRGLPPLPPPPKPAAPPAAQSKAAAAQAEADEKQRILAALAQTNWNRMAAAQSLGLPRRTFYRRLKEYGIQ